MLVFGVLIASGVLYVGAKLRDKLQGKADTPENATRSGNVRDRQLQAISSTGGTPVGDLEHEIDHYLVVSAGAVGLTTAGALVYSPLSLLSVPVVLYTALPIFRSAYNTLLEEHRLKATALDSLAIIGSVVTRYFFACALGTCLYFIGQKLLLKTEDSTRKSLIDVFEKRPRFVWLLRDGVEVEAPYDDLEVGDVIVVNAGETVPVDGRITLGMAAIDQRTLTGEALPADKGVGDDVFAATFVLSGRIHIEIEKAGSDTVAAHIGDILNRTADYRAVLQTRSVQFADQSVLPTLSLSALALLTLGPVSAVAVVNANFSETIRISAPLGMLTFLHLASQRGMLIKDGRSLEILSQVDTIVFDKTGTLTLEQLHVANLYPCGGLDEDALLAYAAAAEYKQSHPIARALQQAAEARSLPLPVVQSATYDVGYGITVRTADHCIQVGSAQFMNMAGVPLPAEVRVLQTQAAEQGVTYVYVALNGQPGGAIALHATIRPEARRVIDALQQRDLSLYIVSGDLELPTRKLAGELGIDHYVAETLPEGKAKLIAQLQEAGKSVCFVGDGINDAIALKQANTSVSLLGASTAAMDTAQVVLMDQSLNQLDHLFDLAQDFDTNTKINLATAVVPGLLCVGGIFFLNFGIFSAMMFYNLSIFAGIGNAMMPWVHSGQEESGSAAQ